MTKAIAHIKSEIVDLAKQRDAAFERGNKAQEKLDATRNRLEPQLRELERRGDELAQEMRHCMDSSQESWSNNDRAGAKEWSVRGHDFKAKCKEINDQARIIREALKNSLDEVKSCRQETKRHKDAIASLRNELEDISAKQVFNYNSFRFDAFSDDAWKPLVNAWARAYRADSNGAKLYVISLDNGYTYLFDDPDGDPRQKEKAAAVRDSRVVAVRGSSSKPEEKRNKSRMAGFPRPQRQEDHRGHLAALASGGGYDINLVPMDGKLNLGKRLREMEIYCAKNPGTPFFMRLEYKDGSDRPSSFDVGVVRDSDLWVKRLKNG